MQNIAKALRIKQSFNNFFGHLRLIIACFLAFTSKGEVMNRKLVFLASAFALNLLISACGTTEPATTPPGGTATPAGETTVPPTDTTVPPAGTTTTPGGTTVPPAGTTTPGGTTVPPAGTTTPPAATPGTSP